MKSVLKIEYFDDETGEVRSDKYKFGKSRIKYGFSICYPALFDALSNVIRSNVDAKIVFYIISLFKSKTNKTEIDYIEVAKMFNVSSSKVSKLLGRMVKYEILMRVGRGKYLINPFMYIPYKANGYYRQNIWKSLKKN